MTVAGSRVQGPVGPGPPGLGARPTRGLGPGGWVGGWVGGAFSSQITIFSQTSWWEPGEGVGVG